MKFVYKPEGAKPRSWDFNPDKLMNAEAEAIERHTGWTFGEFVDKFGNSSMLAIHAVLYVLLKRAEPTLRWDSVQFSLSEVDIEVDDDEAAQAIAGLQAKESSEGLTANERAQLAAFVAQYGNPDEARPKD